MYLEKKLQLWLMKKNQQEVMKLNFPPQADPPPVEMEAVYRQEFTSIL
jgi:hypothetical protein